MAAVKMLFWEKKIKPKSFLFDKRKIGKSLKSLGVNVSVLSPTMDWCVVQGKPRPHLTIGLGKTS